MVAGLVAARRTLQISPDQPAIFFLQGRSGAGHIHADSNGCAAGNTLEEAIVQGFLELVERDSYAIWWYNRLQRPEVDLEPVRRFLRPRPASPACRNRTPALGARHHQRSRDSELCGDVAFGRRTGRNSSSSVPARTSITRIALLRALTELNQFLSIGLMGGGAARQPSHDGTGPLRLQDHPYLTPNGDPADPTGLRLEVRPSRHARAGAWPAWISPSSAGLDFLVLDQTRPDIEVPVVRVIVPGLRHFYRRFAPGRLYDVPVKLGLLDRPLSESELNPIHPHT